MSIRMKLANWLLGGDIENARAHNGRMQERILHLLGDRAKLSRRIADMAESDNAKIDDLQIKLKAANDQSNELRAALKRIYDTPCGPHSNGSQRKIRRIAAHALWKD